jgi:hypothetical protein
MSLLEAKLKIVKSGCLAQEDTLLTQDTFQAFICEGPGDIYLPRATLTPSESSMNHDQERNLRLCYSISIRHASKLLSLSCQTSALACSLFHRFYYKQAFTDRHPARLYAMAALFLASKMEETPRKYKDCISVFYCLE